ncbi:MAG: ATP-binding cassette domain-containing protein [Syntrophales bacterium LBB04]|nr:ATP-binding cassette domain-containing protein [Syntrophales bacterium LBB04]
MQTSIDALNLRKNYDDLLAVDNVSFHVLPGECFGILGPNGAGKTSIIRMIYGFSPMTGGVLKVFGLDSREHLRTIKGRLGVCQQENSLDPDLTVRQNLEVFARYFNIPRRVSEERTQRLLKFMALDHRQDSRALDLSGGMMRRLIIARALINEPELLILDEPTTGLDPQSRHQVWERLEELRAGGLAILLTTHYMDEATRLCDRVMIMDHGRILVEGEPARLIKYHIGSDIIEVTAPTDDVRNYIKTRQLQHEDLGHKMIIYVEEGRDMFHEIGNLCGKEGCIMRMATLEDVFLKLTGRDLRE